MKKVLFLLLKTILFLLLATSAMAADHNETLLYEVRIPFEMGGIVKAILPDGRNYELGSVVRLPEKTRWPSYTASAWGKPGSVTASAVNAMHLLVGVEDGKGRTMSIIPQETIAPAAGTDASIVLDCRAGTGIFGAWAPPVGTPILIKSADGSLRPLKSGNLPKPGEVMLFYVYEADVPYFVEFENRPGGRVTSWSKNSVTTIARVIRPVKGVGRFDGTLYQEPGRIRASHSGVIDVSTSPAGQIGGFQIIPWDHALQSKEMQGSWQLTQWMIIAAPDGESMLGGSYPLFAGGLIPGPSDGEEMWDLWSTYGRKPLVLVRENGGSWSKMPSASGKIDDALASVTHLRIYFPITEEPLSKTE